MLVVGGYDGQLRGISNAGAARWKLGLDGRSGPPTPYGDRVYVADGTGSLHAVSSDGARLWGMQRAGILDRLFGDDDPVAVGAPAADARGVYATFAAKEPGEIAVVGADHDGNHRWQQVLDDAGDRCVRNPTVADGTVYTVVGDTVVALDADDGSEQWQFATGYPTPGPVTTDGDRLYVPAKNLIAVDVASGRERWRVVNESVVTDDFWSRGVPYVARPAVAEGAVHIRAGAFDATGGTRLWGNDADTWVDGDNYYDDSFRHRPSVQNAVTSDGLYLTHTINGVLRFG